MISQEIKNNVFNQIEEFRDNELRNSGKDIYEYKYYVEPKIAIDRARFFKFIDNEKTTNELKYNNVIDLTFGSGSLTSHILLDNDIEFSKLILNDKNIDDANFSEELGEIAEDITDNNILDSISFNKDQKFDLIIFNPQIGGKDRKISGVKIDGYKKGMLLDSPLPQVDFRLFGEDPLVTLTNHVNLADCVVYVDDQEHSIRIHSNTLNQSEMKSRFEKLKIFNYYDVFFQSKKSKEYGSHSDIVKFRINLEKIIDDNTTIAFMGNDKEFNVFFHEFNCRHIYNSEKEKSFIIGTKNDISETSCYNMDHKDFIKVDCKNKYQTQELDLEETLSQIHEDLLDLKALDGGELFVIENKASIGLKNDFKTPVKPRFKNFLLNYIVKETK